MFIVLEDKEEVGVTHIMVRFVIENDAGLDRSIRLIQCARGPINFDRGIF